LAQALDAFVQLEDFFLESSQKVKGIKANLYGLKLIISKLDNDVLKAIENYKIEKGLLSPREGSSPKN
jgi:hypothetical protein